MKNKPAFFADKLYKSMKVQTGSPGAGLWEGAVVGRHPLGVSDLTPQQQWDLAPDHPQQSRAGLSSNQHHNSFLGLVGEVAGLCLAGSKSSTHPGEIIE